MGNAILNTVYNHYLTTYTPKRTTRYDTHKKSELRGVYDSIVKQNKESPWYLPTTSKDTQHYAVDLKENARELYNTIAQLGGLEEKGLLQKKKASSSNEHIAEATYIGDTAMDADLPSFELKVKSLASPQENLGTFLPNLPIDLPADTYSFDIAINDMNYEFQFAIHEHETNRDVQERLSNLINQSNIGIKASIVESNGRSSLRIVSDSSGLPSGKDAIFTISDTHTSKTAGTVEYFGLDSIIENATNAAYSIDGEDFSSKSNHITINHLYDVTLKQVCDKDESTTIEAKHDLTSFTDSINDLIGGYNSFLKAASGYLESQSKSKQLVKEMIGIASRYQTSFSAIGVDLSKDGVLSINPDQLYQSALVSDDLNTTFSHMKEFSSSLLRKSNEISLNPMDYVSKTIVAYKNPGHNYVSPYASSAYSGMMFNGYC